MNQAERCECGGNRIRARMKLSVLYFLSVAAVRYDSCRKGKPRRYKISPASSFNVIQPSRFGDAEGDRFDDDHPAWGIAPPLL
ncbi:MAG: hypothetical protein ACJ74J_16115 [Blastocatellia bacterium]